MRLHILFLLAISTSAIKNVPLKYMNYNNVKSIIKKIYRNNNKDYNMEHIVPQSFFKSDKNLKLDMHNIILYPSKMNIHRSNYKYISNNIFYKDSKLIDGNGNCIDYLEPIKNNEYCIKTNYKKYFVPCEKYRGQISRACMYVCNTYPKYKDVIFEKVIDPYTILTWHHEYPVNDFEREKNSKIFEYQKNNNQYITNPDRLVEHMDYLINVNLDFYKKYKY